MQAAAVLQRLKDELYNVVSHELRTPLTGILGFGELPLTRDDRLNAEQRKEHLGRILREARWLQRVVDNLVYSSKVIQQDGSAAAGPARGGGRWSRTSRTCPAGSGSTSRSTSR